MRNIKNQLSRVLGGILTRQFVAFCAFFFVIGAVSFSTWYYFNLRFDPYTRFAKKIDENESFVGIMGSYNCEICQSLESSIDNSSFKDEWEKKILSSVSQWKEEINLLEKKRVLIDWFMQKYYYGKETDKWHPLYSKKKWVKEIYDYLYQNSDKNRNHGFRYVNEPLTKEPESIPAPIVFFVRNGRLTAIQVGVEGKDNRKIAFDFIESVYEFILLPE